MFWRSLIVGKVLREDFTKERKYIPSAGSNFKRSGKSILSIVASGEFPEIREHNSFGRGPAKEKKLGAFDVKKIKNALKL